MEDTNKVEATEETVVEGDQLKPASVEETAEVPVEEVEPTEPASAEGIV